MSTDDPNTYEPTRDELLTLNAALRLRLDLSVEALRGAVYALKNACYELTDADLLKEAKEAAADAGGVLAVATGESADIPKRLFRNLSLHRQDTAKKLLEATR